MATLTAEQPTRFRREEEFGERIVLASYPRSGNSMVRKLLEEMTGIHTGSDTRPKRAMAEMLRGYGLQGESDVTRKTWVIKSHFPERHGWMKFPARRGILLVRNPINAIDSYFNMQLSANHEMSLDESQYERFSEIWNEHVLTEAKVWAEFHNYWLDQKIPLLIIRYEDLLSHRDRELGRMYRFLYRPTEVGEGGGGGGSSATTTTTTSSSTTTTTTTNVSGTPWVSPSEMSAANVRFQKVIQNISANSGVVYKPRKASINPNYTHYTQAQQDAVLQVGDTCMRAFGYVADGYDRSTIALPQPLVRCLNKNEIMTLKVNDGPVCRELTEEDPFGRGFPWKWKIRQVVMLEGKSDPGAVNQVKWLEAQAERAAHMQENPYANTAVKEDWPMDVDEGSMEQEEEEEESSKE